MSLGRLLTLTLSAFLAAACAPIEDPYEPDPIGERQDDQLSGGVGFSIFHFKVGGVGVGRVLVTDGEYGGSYQNQVEYWKWDPIAGASLRAGTVNNITIDVIVQSDTWSSSDVTTHFESGTSGWLSWSIPRAFELQSSPGYVWTTNSAERYVYTLDADAWGQETGTVRYYLEVDFHPGSDIPSLEWYVDADDIKTYYYSEDSDEDDDEDFDWEEWELPPEAYEDATRWEVRLEQDAVISKVSWGYGYELRTLYQ